MTDNPVSQAQISEIMRLLSSIEASQGRIHLRFDTLQKTVTDHLVSDASALARIDTSLTELSKSVNDDLDDLKDDVNRRSWIGGLSVGLAGLAQLMGIKLPHNGG